MAIHAHKTTSNKHIDRQMLSILQSMPEDMQHFLCCSHPLHKPTFQVLQQQVSKLH